VDDTDYWNKPDMTTTGARRLLIPTLTALTLALLLAGCDHGPAASSLAGGVTPPAPAGTGTTDSPPAGPPLSVSSLAPAADGLGPVIFGTEAARALAELTQALGPSEKPTLVAAGTSCDATRMFQWRNLQVLVNEVMPGAGTTAGFVGWSLTAGGRVPLSLKTDKGVGIGSTLAALRSTYGGNLAIVQTEPVPVFTITTPAGVITGQLDGQAPASTVRTLRAGTFCGD